MLKVMEVAFSFWAVTDLDLVRARGFYEGVLGIGPLASPVCRMAIVCDPDGNTICIPKRSPGRDFLFY